MPRRISVEAHPAANRVNHVEVPHSIKLLLPSWKKRHFWSSLGIRCIRCQKAPSLQQCAEQGSPCPSSGPPRLQLRVYPDLPCTLLGLLLRCGWRPSYLRTRGVTGADNGALASSLSNIEIAVHFKVQDPALSRSAHASSHFGEHVQSPIAYHNMRAAQHDLRLCRLALKLYSISMCC